MQHMRELVAQHELLLWCLNQQCSWINVSFPLPRIPFHSESSFSGDWKDNTLLADKMMSAYGNAKTKQIEPEIVPLVQA